MTHAPENATVAQIVREAEEIVIALRETNRRQAQHLDAVERQMARIRERIEKKLADEHFID